MKRRCLHSFVTSFNSIFYLMVMMFALLIISSTYLMRMLHPRYNIHTSMWRIRLQDVFDAVPVQEGNLANSRLHAATFLPKESPFMILEEKEKSRRKLTRINPKTNKVYTISYYDPEKELQFFEKVDFSKCEYFNCHMIAELEKADALIFYAVKLKQAQTPNFTRRPDQIWILKTDEAPSRFSWFESLNRSGIRDQINWTMTHKLTSDIPDIYGEIAVNGQQDDRNYDQIYNAKNKTAAWFVSHCPVRSDRSLYVDKMATRVDVDIYGACGSLTCGQGEKIPGVAGMRVKADKETCFPLLSTTYRFYLAFENSLCQEYVTEKFFKLFNDVDVVPVVRGGADYKSYFPPNTFVDASDFNSPESLADFLEDLGNDRDMYILYLRNKNRFRVVEDYPDWQCKMCAKLNQDRKHKVYDNIQEWFTRDSCADPKDFSY